MDKYILMRKIAEYNKNKTNVSHIEHCPMDIIMEEIFSLDDLNILVIGMEECSFYSKKHKYDNNRVNWSYELTDKEIIFGDLNDIREALKELNCISQSAICIITCVPSLISLGIEEISHIYPNICFIKAPHFSYTNSSLDVLRTLYLELYRHSCFTEEILNNKEITLWENNLESYFNFIKKCKNKKHMVLDLKYLDAVKENCSDHDFELIDMTSFIGIFKNIDYIELLGIKKEVVLHFEDKIKKHKGIKISIKGLDACSLALFLECYGLELVEVKSLNCSFKEIDSCKLLRCNNISFLDEEFRDKAEVYFDYSLLSDKLEHLNSFERNKYILNAMERVWD